MQIESIRRLRHQRLMAAMLLVCLASVATSREAGAQAQSGAQAKNNAPAQGGALAVNEIAVRHEAGQTFITWSDVAAGAAGADYRYTILRSNQPITAANAAKAQVAMRGVLNNSAKMLGYAYAAADRIDPSKPTMKFSIDGPALPEASGLAVVTVENPGDSYYAVVATDLEGNPLTKVVPGQSATTDSVKESPHPIQVFKLRDNADVNSYARTNQGDEVPLYISLHGSQRAGGPAVGYGNLYYYFGTKAMGYHDGLPGCFAFSRARTRNGYRLMITPRDTIVSPNGLRGFETYWLGYVCVPQGAEGTPPMVYPFTEARLLWMIDWAIENFRVDRNRISIGGGSMGAGGSLAFAMQQPDIFAAVYPDRPRPRRFRQASLVPANQIPDPLMMSDGKTPFLQRVDTVHFVSTHHEDLPFLGWGTGRQDTSAPWPDQVDLVQAMTAARHGFAFAWNNGNHSTGTTAIRQVHLYYPADKFALNQSYPALTHSSIDSKIGGGDPNDGDPEGGINLGFDWSDVVDAPERWSVKLSNALCSAPMTVDVTPRRCQQFKVKPGERFTWSDGRGATGEVVADQYGLVTVERLGLLPKEATQLTISRK